MTWKAENKVLPGAYINIKTNTPLEISIGQRGVVALPLAMDWGEEQKIIEITKDINTTPIVGTTIDKFLPLREIFKNATKVLLYRVNSGDKAKADLDSTKAIKVEAKYSGKLGNNLTIVSASIEDTTTFRVSTLYEGTIIDSQVVEVWSDLENNDYINFIVPEDAIDEVAKNVTVNLTGGSSIEATDSDYDKALEAIGTYYFNVIICDSEDPSIKSKFEKFIENLREEEEIRCQVVMFSYDSADYEGVINVGNAVILEGGGELTMAQTCYWVGGATAGATLSQSNTSKVYLGAIDVKPRFKKSEKIDRVKKGQFIFSVDNNQRVTVVQDINTHRTFTQEKDYSLRKNRVIRCLDTIANDIVTIWRYQFEGRITNDINGRNLFRGRCIEHLNAIQRLNGIENFTPEDVQVFKGIEKDAVRSEMYVQTLDSMEKLYLNINA